MTSINVNNLQTIPSGLSGAETAAQADNSASREVLRQQLAAEVQKAAESAASEPSPEELRQAVRDIGDYLSVASRSLNIRVDQELEKPVVTVLDRDTEAVVRQIPSEEALAIARFIRSQRETLEGQTALAGVIFKDQG